jgi:glycosyltransferase involved in cell wall biosynthesis
MRVTVLSHDLSTNAGRRTHRLAAAAGTFADVKLIGPASRRRRWLDLPDEPGVVTVRKRRWPGFHSSFVELVEAADGDVLIAVKPHLASFAVALVASELRGVPVILDIDDLDVALAARSARPATADLARPKSPLFVSLLSRATGAADAITVCCRALQERFGGTVVPQPVDTDLFDPATTDRGRARREFGFDGPTVLFPGVPRPHKGFELLADAVARVPGAHLAVTCRSEDLAGPRWAGLPIHRVGMVPYRSAPALYAAADVIAIPQLDDEAAHHQMPLKAVDAMAMGRPIVASAVSDLPEVLDGCGRVVPPGDPGALAAAIAELLEDRPQAEQLGSGARERCVERYSLERVGAQLGAIVGGLGTAQPAGAGALGAAVPPAPAGAHGAAVPPAPAGAAR